MRPPVGVVLVSVTYDAALAPLAGKVPSFRLSLWSEGIGTKQDYLCLDYYYSNVFQNSGYFAMQSIPRMEEAFAALLHAMTA
jgi:hypothetical protein